MHRGVGVGKKPNDETQSSSLENKHLSKRLGGLGIPSPL